jgi:hypothetical protein
MATYHCEKTPKIGANYNDRGITDRLRIASGTNNSIIFSSYRREI